jgi:molecular chaperone HscB
MDSKRTYFDVLGIEPTYDVDRAELEKRYLELSRQLHPDRFARASAKEKLASVTKTTELNDAYRVLKDDRRRAEYLLKLAGVDVGDDRTAPKVDSTTLMQIMELNEELAEARAERDSARVAALAGRVRAAREEAWGVVEAALRDEGDERRFQRAAQAMMLMRYHDRFLEQVDAYEGVLASEAR